MNKNLARVLSLAIAAALPTGLFAQTAAPKLLAGLRPECSSP